MHESVAFGSFSKTAFVGGHNTTSLHKELKSFHGVLELCPFEGHLTEYYYVNKQEFQRTNSKLKRAEVARFGRIPFCPINRVFSFNACSISALQTTHSRAVQCCAQPRSSTQLNTFLYEPISTIYRIMLMLQQSFCPNETYVIFDIARLSNSADDFRS